MYNIEVGFGGAFALGNMLSLSQVGKVFLKGQGT